MGELTPEQRLLCREATARAMAVVKPGDRVSRKRCLDTKSTFTFTHWEYNAWMCGRTVSDCAAEAVYAVNGKAVDFTTGPPVDPRDLPDWPVRPPEPPPDDGDDDIPF